MAKSRTVINSQMPNPMKVSTTQAPGIYGHNTPPFDAPQSMGNGGIPTKFFDTTMTGAVGDSTTPKAVPGGSTSPSSNLMAPGKNMPTRARSAARPPGGRGRR